MQSNAHGREGRGEKELLIQLTGFQINCINSGEGPGCHGSVRPSLNVQLVKNGEQDGRVYKESDAARYGKYSVFKNLWFADTV